MKKNRFSKWIGSDSSMVDEYQDENGNGVYEITGSDSSMVDEYF